MKRSKIALKRIEELEQMLGSVKQVEQREQGSVRLSYGKMTGNTELVRTIPLRTCARGELRLEITYSSSLTVGLSVRVDGEEGYAERLTAGSGTKSFSLFGVDKGERMIELSFTGASITLNSLNVSVTGYVEMRDGDVYAQGFDDGSGYLVLTLGRLEVFSTSDTVPYFTLNGVRDARAFSFNEKNYACLSMKNGCFAVVECDGSASPWSRVLCGEALCGCGCAIGGRMEFFVCTAKGVRKYVYDPLEDEVFGGNVVMDKADELLAFNLGEDAYLFSVKKGYIFLSKISPSVRPTTLDRFTFSCGVEL